MTRLATINLESADPRALARFYIDRLGMTEDVRRSNGDDFVYLTSSAGHMTIARPAINSSAKPSSTMEIGFETDDLDALRSGWTAAGNADLKVTDMGWGRVIETVDPDGYRIVIYQSNRQP